MTQSEPRSGEMSVDDMGWGDMDWGDMDWGGRIGNDGLATRQPVSNTQASRRPDTAGAAEAPFFATVAAMGDRAVGEHLRGWPTPSGHPSFATPAAGGLDIVFGRDGNAGGMIREGWSVPEPGYIWTIGDRSTLVLPRPLAPARHALQIQLAPFVHPGRLEAQRLGLDVNGVRVASWEIAEQAILSIELPRELLAAREAVELVFTLPDAARPVDVSGFADDRVLGFSLRRLMLTPAAGAVPLPAAIPLVPKPATSLPLDVVMMSFENLGENCEFGLVQRRCGAEPLGLLRFASAPLPKLLAALRGRFAGMGAPKNVIVELSANGREYMVQDRAYGFTYHAWVQIGEQTPAQIHAREVRRVPFLVRKLIEDLEDGEKIFVYHGMEPLSLANAQNLSAAVRAYGPGKLLWVELADAAHPAGSVEWVEDGLMKGAMDRFAPGEDAHDFALNSWTDLCVSAYEAACSR